MRHRLPSPQPPAEVAILDGLPYTLWMPAAEPWAGLVILHGAGSRKENHHDMARAAREAGMAAMVPDLRGHGESAGAMDARVLDDVAALAERLRERLAEAGAPGAPVALRGSSMGGALAILAARRVRAAAVVAICPAIAAELARGLRAGDFDFRADTASLGAFLAACDVAHAAAELDVPLLLLHAEGDEVVPVEHSREMARRAPRARLVALPGGHHRSVQHDPELQGEALRWLRRSLLRVG